MSEHDRSSATGTDAEQTVERTGRQAEDAVRRTADDAKAGLHRAEARVKDKVKATETKVRHQVDEVQRTVGEIKGLSEPTAATSVAEAASQASDLRRALDRDLDALQAKLPPADELATKAKTVGGAALGVVGVVVAGVLAAKQRGERKRVDREARAHAAAIARYLPGASARPEPEPERSGGKGLLVVLALAGAGVAAYLVSRASQGDEEPDVWGPAT